MFLKECYFNIEFCELSSVESLFYHYVTYTIAYLFVECLPNNDYVITWQVRVPLGVFGDGRLALPPGRKGEVIAV